MPSYSSSGNVLAQASDPGAIGAGSYWADTDAEITLRRNDANTAWLNLLQTEKGTTFPTSPTKSDLFIHTDIGLAYQFGGWKTNPYIWGSFNEISIYDDMVGYADQTAFDAYWISNDTALCRGNTTNDNIDFNLNISSSDKNIYFDFGKTLSDTAWIIRFRMRFSTLTSAANAFFHIVLSSVAATGSGSTVDSIGIRVSNETVQKSYGTYDTDGTALNVAVDTQSAAIAWATATDYYVEIKRTSATAYTATIYTDSAFTTTLVAATTGTAVATTASLRYFSICNSAAASAGVFTGTIDEVFIIDGRTAFT